MDDIILESECITEIKPGAAKLGILDASGDVVIQSKTAAKDIIFKQFDNNEVLRIDDNGSAVAAVLDVTGLLTVGTDANGADVTFHSGTAGDNFVWDADQEVLNITGTDAQTALDVLDGDVRVVDKLYLFDRGGE